jgi:hypothetical protein
MAEQKRVRRKGTRAMMRPKPDRVRGSDPFKPQMVVHGDVWGTVGDDDRLLPSPDGGVGWYTRHVDAFLFVDESYVPIDWNTVRMPRRPYRSLAALKLLIERRKAKALTFSHMYGAGADYLRGLLGTRTGEGFDG